MSLRLKFPNAVMEIWRNFGGLAKNVSSRSGYMKSAVILAKRCYTEFSPSQPVTGYVARRNAHTHGYIVGQFQGLGIDSGTQKRRNSGLARTLFAGLDLLAK